MKERVNHSVEGFEMQVRMLNGMDEILEFGDEGVPPDSSR
jgi:hypothetical protein